MLLKSLLLSLNYCVYCQSLRVLLLQEVQQMYTDKGAKHELAMKVVFEGDSYLLRTQYSALLVLVQITKAMAAYSFTAFC